MEGTWTTAIISNGMTAFSPIIDKLGDIATEFVPYLIGIAVAVLWIALTFRVVKWILGYLKGWAMKSVRGK